MSDLERRIAAALSADIPSSEIEALIVETQEAIEEAEITAEGEREKALDLTASPDAKAAREAVATAEFARDRLRTVLPRLQERHERVTAAEYRQQWKTDGAALEAERDALVEEFREIYPNIEQKLPDLLQRMAVIDAKISRLNAARPAGSKSLAYVELVARGLERFTRDAPSIASELRLPKFAADARLAWPRRP